MLSVEMYVEDLVLDQRRVGDVWGLGCVWTIYLVTQTGTMLAQSPWPFSS